MLGGTVGIQELSCEVYYGLAVPLHLETGLFHNVGYLCGFKVFLLSRRNEFLGISLADNDSHSLLALGNGKLGAVKSVVLFGNSVEIDYKSVCKLTYGNGYAACTEVVAALDHPCHLGIPEQPLQLSLLGGIALLYLCTAGGEGILCM